MSFAYLKYSDDDHGGFKAAAARPYPHLHHQVQVQSCLNFSRYTLLPTRSPLPPSTSKLSGQVATAQPPPTPASWKLRVEAESGDRAQRRPPALVLSCSLVGPVPLTVVPLWFHSPSVAFLAARSDLPSLHLACFLLIYAFHHALIPQ